MYYKVLFDYRSKNLITTNKIDIYQREKGVDKFMFIFPRMYGDVDLRDCIILMQYTDQANVAQSIVVELEDEDYKDDYVVTYVPIDLRFTKFAGNINNIRFHINKLEDNMTYDILHTNDMSIEVKPLTDIYTSNDNSMEFVDSLLAQMQAQIKRIEDVHEAYSYEKADGIIATVDDDHNVNVQLTSMGQPIGESVIVGDDGEIGQNVFDLNE